MTKPAPKLELTAEQRRAIKSVREQVERDRPEIVAEGRRVAAAAADTAVQLRGAFTLLRALRQSQGLSLAALAERTGISKPALSRLENDPNLNVTLNTLHRVADALGHELRIAVAPKLAAKVRPKRKPLALAGSQD